MPSVLIAILTMPFFLILSVGDADAAQQVTSQQPGPQVQPVVTVITVSAEPIPLNEAPAMVTVVDRDFIESAHANSFADLLRTIPNLYLSQTDGRGALTSITIRGGKPNFTLVMLDGIPINDIANILGGSFDFSSLSPDNIERIEIVSGPLSSLYGSEAISGVINIISRHSEHNQEVEIQGEFGNFDSRQGRFSLGGAVGRSSYSLEASYLDMGPQVERDHYSLATLAFSGDHTFDHGIVLRALARFHDKESLGFPPNGGGPLYSILRDLKSDHAREGIFGLALKQQVNPLWLYGVDADLFLRHETASTPPILDSTPPTSNSLPSEFIRENFRRQRLGLSNVFTIKPFLSADLGIRFKNEHGTNHGVIADVVPDSFTLDRSTLTFSGGLLFHPRNVTLTVGLGIDHTSTVTAVSPRAGISYILRPSLTMKASWGTGFSLPSFEALGDPIVGNRELRPEHTNGFDAGFEKSFRPYDFHLAVTYYRNTFRDLIDFSPQQFKLVNRSVGETQGGEWTFRLSPIHQLTFSGHLTYLNARLLNTKERLRDLPRWRGGFEVDWRVSSRVHARIDTLVVGRRYDFQVPLPSRDTAPEYTTTNCVLTYEATDRTSFYVRADNLFNTQYQEFLGFPSGGVYARAGFNYRFSRRRSDTP